MPEYTDVNGVYPNPEEFIAAHYAELTSKILEALHEESLLGKFYTDDQIKVLEAKLQALIEDSNLIERVGKLQKFLADLDKDQDGNIDIIVTLQERVAAQAARIKAVIEAADTNAVAVKKLRADFDAYSDSTNKLVSGINADLVEVDEEIVQLQEAIKKDQAILAELTKKGEETIAGVAANTEAVAAVKVEAAELEFRATALVAKTKDETVAEVYRTVRDGFKKGLAGLVESVEARDSAYAAKEAPEVEEQKPTPSPEASQERRAQS